MLRGKERRGKCGDLGVDPRTKPGGKRGGKGEEEQKGRRRKRGSGRATEGKPSDFGKYIKRIMHLTNV
jgi:hypothetical protein